MDHGRRTAGDLAAFEKAKAESAGFLASAKEILGSIAGMPKVMLQRVVQFFSWFAFFVWSYATPALTEHVFASPNPEAGAVNFEVANAAFNEAANSVSSAMGVYGLSSMAFACCSPYTSRYSINRCLVHGVSLAIDGLGFADAAIESRQCRTIEMVLCVHRCSLGFDSLHAIRYAIKFGAKDQMGIYMGIFNMFIVIPQILSAWWNQLGERCAFRWKHSVHIAGSGAGALSLVLVDRSVH